MDCLKFKTTVSLIGTATALLLFTGCQGQVKNAAGVSTANVLGTTPTTSSSPSTSTTSSTGPQAVQILLNTGTSGSFDLASVPASGGTYAYASRFFDLRGNQITTSQYTSWWFQPSSGAGVFLTSTSTSYPGGGSGATSSTSGRSYLTPCAYFDRFNDNNPETAGYYTIDGIVPNAQSLSETTPTTTPTADIDQCAGITNGERAKLGAFFTINRSYLASTDKLQVIIRAKPLNAPNTAPVPSSCVIGGLFDATACSNSVFTVTMRTALSAAARPFFMLFPSAKSLDLLSESVLIPMNIDTTMTTVTIDRLKGGAVLYSITVVRVP